MWESGGQDLSSLEDALSFSSYIPLFMQFQHPLVFFMQC